ncbi:unnamed protein product [Angiostrongylus costaricensis]|uniref:Reverse transcriptase domain-containing protein n=1 Tax=Angiostrongylus costaricensis TaxID=334426 RepID=A0A0R3PF59_ANGCS|nr:unnamed protein product [Angiostrongylus costaricensis]
MDHIHTVTRLIEVSREYKRPLCLTFIDLQKAFDSVEMEAVLEVLDSQEVLTQYIRILRELNKKFTAKTSPFYNDISNKGKGGVSKAIPFLYLRFADDILHITANISKAKLMFAHFDKACEKIGLRLNLTKTMLMRNVLAPYAPFTLNGTNISDCSSHVYLGREIDMLNDLAQELSRRK